MIFPGREAVAGRKRLYRPGTRIRLVRMADIQAPPTGTKGTVRFVDDIGQIHVAWDNGSSLAVTFEDAVELI